MPQDVCEFALWKLPRFSEGLGKKASTKYLMHVSHVRLNVFLKIIKSTQINIHLQRN